MNRYEFQFAVLVAGALFWNGHSVAANHVVLVGGNNNTFSHQIPS